MERIHLENFKGSVIYTEHRHRYEWVTRFAHGVTIDVACGEGYGGEILTRGTTVSQYRGIDVSDEAIRVARDRSQNWISKERVTFEVGSIFEIRVADRSVDTVVSLETLEHLEDPDRAIVEVKRVLKSDGILIGSVPTDVMEDLCTKTYGANQYHVQKFSLSDIERLLSVHFRYFSIWKVEMNIGSLFTFLISSQSDSIPQKSLIETSRNNPHLGSFLFLASDDRRIFNTIPQNSFFCGINFTEYEGINVVPLRAAYKQAERLVYEKEKIIRDQTFFVKAPVSLKRKIIRFLKKLKW